MQKSFILSIPFNKAYLLYVLESENASYWYVSKSIKGHASKSRGENEKMLCMGKTSTVHR
jgi:hypothetical protein